MRSTPFFALAVLISASAPGFCQTATPDGENGRFTFNPVSDGLLRLDTRSGQVSLCSNRSAGWACQTVPDERAALEGEIGRLQNENARLKREMLARGLPLPGAQADASKHGAQIELRLPSDAEVERVMTFFEKVWRRLIEMVHSVQKDTDRKG